MIVWFHRNTFPTILVYSPAFSCNVLYAELYLTTWLPSSFICGLIKKDVFMVVNAQGVINCDFGYGKMGFNLPPRDRYRLSIKHLLHLTFSSIVELSLTSLHSDITDILG